MLINGYTFIRRDRTKHRGLGIYVRNSLKHRIVNNLLSKKVEVLRLKISLSKSEPFLIRSVYRPLCSNANYKECMIDNFQKGANQNPNVLILGDFNIDVFNGNHGSFVEYVCSVNNVKQLVSEATRVTPHTKSLIDLILSSSHEDHSYTSVVKTCLSDHYLVMTNINSYLPHPHMTVKCRSYKKFNETSFRKDVKRQLGNIAINDDIHIDEIWNVWKNIFNEICDKHAPIKSFRVKGHLHPWVDNDTVMKMRQRDKIHGMAVKNNDSELFDKYRKLRNEITTDIKQSKKIMCLKL